MNSKGFVITVDAMAAAFVLFSFLLAINQYYAQIQVRGWNDLELFRFSDSALGVLENSGELEYAVLSNQSTRIRSYLNDFPANVCAELLVYAQSDLNVPLLSVSKEGCSAEYDVRSTALHSTVVHYASDLNFFVAQLNGWYRK